MTGDQASRRRAGRPAHLDVARAGRPGRQRRGGGFRRPRGPRSTAPGDHRRRCPAHGRPTGLATRTADAIAALRRPLRALPVPTLTVPCCRLRRRHGVPVVDPAGQPSDVVLVHEVAHMWFYGMVGNSQFRDPWLDEAFASYAEGLATSRRPRGRRSARTGTWAGRWPTSPTTAATSTAVYSKGAAALLAARDAGRRRRVRRGRCAATSTRRRGRSRPRRTSPRALADLPEALEVLVAGRGPRPGGPARPRLSHPGSLEPTTGLRRATDVKGTSPCASRCPSSTSPRSPAGRPPASSFAASVALAQRAEELGYRRVWYAEHHNMSAHRLLGDQRADRPRRRAHRARSGSAPAASCCPTTRR